MSFATRNSRVPSGILGRSSLLGQHRGNSVITWALRSSGCGLNCGIEFGMSVEAV